MVVPIIDAQLALLIGESKVAGKQFDVGGKAGIQGIAPAVNDPRVRKDLVNDAEMQKIAKILVDDSSRERGVAPQSLEGHVGDRPIAGLAHLEKRAQPYHLAGAMNVRMGGQYLFDQRGAATWHAHDEDRHLGEAGWRRSPPNVGVRRTLGARRHLPRSRARVVVGGGALQAIALLAVRKSPVR